MALCREQILLPKPVNRIFNIEEKKEVFAGFRKKERFLAILKRFVIDVVYGGVATVCLGVVVQAK